MCTTHHSRIGFGHSQKSRSDSTPEKEEKKSNRLAGQLFPLSFDCCLRRKRNLNGRDRSNSSWGGFRSKCGRKHRKGHSSLRPSQTHPHKHCNKPSHWLPNQLDRRKSRYLPSHPSKFPHCNPDRFQSKRRQSDQAGKCRSRERRTWSSPKSRSRTHCQRNRQDTFRLGSSSKLRGEIGRLANHSGISFFLLPLTLARASIEVGKTLIAFAPGISRNARTNSGTVAGGRDTSGPTSTGEARTGDVAPSSNGIKRRTRPGWNPRRIIPGGTGDGSGSPGRSLGPRTTRQRVHLTVHLFRIVLFVCLFVF